jgi:hypothetical protein
MQVKIEVAEENGSRRGSAHPAASMRRVNSMNDGLL